MCNFIRIDNPYYICYELTNRLVQFKQNFYLFAKNLFEYRNYLNTNKNPEYSIKVVKNLELVNNIILAWQQFKLQIRDVLLNSDVKTFIKKKKTKFLIKPYI